MNEVPPNRVRVMTGVVFCAVIAVLAALYGVVRMRHTTSSGTTVTLLALGTLVVGVSFAVAATVAQRRPRRELGGTARTGQTVLYALIAITSYRAAAAGGIATGAVMFMLAGYFGAMCVLLPRRRDVPPSAPSPG